jgi:hypothetical protein
MSPFGDRVNAPGRRKTRNQDRISLLPSGFRSSDGLSRGGILKILGKMENHSNPIFEVI